ncbi:MAG: M61 family metallopeptidase [Gemmatimonadota bacterium]|nr:M61 family metallopeptidase [Gemmatimonadota bacterium]
MLRYRLGPVALALAGALSGGAAFAPAAAQHPGSPDYSIAYDIAMPDPASHLYHVRLDVGGLAADTIALQMPVWSPGRYAPMFFAKNVQRFSVTTPDGRPVQWDRTDGSRWRLHVTGVPAVRVEYLVYADAPMSGTFSVLDTIHATWNGPSLFMYVERHKPDPVTLHVVPPAGWHIINGDAASPDQTDYRFENYDRLVDTPTEVAPEFMVDSFTVDGVLYRTMVHHNGPTTPDERSRFVGDVRKIVTYENSVFGPPPIRMYTFLFHIGFPGGDGMEHLFSTQIADRRPRVAGDSVLAGVATAAHEYFHVWNVKRVRPMLLGPFDYTRERYEPSLWVAEGWTQYYGMMALHRAGITGRAQMLSAAATIVQSNLTAPGRKETSPRMASFEAPFWDQAGQAQPVNANQIFFSYYYAGAGRALYLDLLIRERTHDRRALDDAFSDLRKRSWYQPDASYYLQGRGYTEADVEAAVNEAAGTNLHDWFDRCVGGTDDVDFDGVLAGAGLRLDRSGPRWTIELEPNPTPDQLRVRNGWLTGTKG